MAKISCLVCLLTVLLLSGCGEKEEVNPQVVNNPSAELQEKMKAAGADAAPAGGGTPSSSIN
ncbi:MAG: hypothetical protein H7Y17_12880 [Chlorobia bacterium]|nr:hypothetical protein [Fimbriimonadaceae bacterium]